MMKLNGLPAVIAVTQLCVVASALCPSGWTQHGSLCYFFSIDYATWMEAGAACKMFSTKLAEPRTYSEAQFISGIAQQKNNYFWIGITDMIVEDEWIYPTGMTPIVINHFQPGQPDQHTVNNCVATWPAGSSNWGDEPCSQRYRFVCEKPLNDGDVFG